MSLTVATLPFTQLDTVLAKADITQHEIAALRTRYNLADAHTHQNQSPTQRKIVKSLPKLWDEAAGQSQYQSRISSRRSTVFMGNTGP